MQVEVLSNERHCAPWVRSFGSRLRRSLRITSGGAPIITARCSLKGKSELPCGLEPPASFKQSEGGIRWCKARAAASDTKLDLKRFEEQRRAKR